MEGGGRGIIWEFDADLLIFIELGRCGNESVLGATVIRILNQGHINISKFSNMSFDRHQCWAAVELQFLSRGLFIYVAPPPLNVAFYCYYYVGSCRALEDGYLLVVVVRFVDVGCNKLVVVVVGRRSRNLCVECQPLRMS